jgi:hypothetical protein
MGTETLNENTLLNLPGRKIPLAVNGERAQLAAQGRRRAKRRDHR